MADGFNLGTAYAKVLIDGSELDKSIVSVQKKFDTLGKGMQTVGKSLLAVTTPILAFGAAAVKEFADSQAGVAQLDAVLKSTGQTAGVTRDMALNLAAGFQQVTQYSDDAVLSGENMLLTFTNIGKDVFPAATQTILDMSTALGQDLQSSAIQLGKALNDPIAGISALSRVGVTFSESQKAAIEQMMKMGDIAGAQKIILAELQREFGGSAVAAGSTFAGSLVILQNKLNDIQETIGGALVPVLSDLVKTYISPIVDKIADWVTKNPELIRQIAGLATVGAALGGALYIVGAILPSIVSGIGLLLSPVVLLAIAIGGLVYAASQLYPGGLSQLFADASKAAKELGTIGLFLLADTLNKASIAAQELVNIGLFVLIDTLNRAAISAGILVLIVQFTLISTLNNLSIAAQAVIKAVADWIEQNGFLVRRIEDLIATIALVKAGILAYNTVMSITTAVTTALASGTSVWAAAMTALSSPIVAATAAVYALIAAYHELQNTTDYLQKGGAAVSGAAAGAIKNNGLTHDEFMAKAFAAAQSQFGDLGARLWWDQQYGRIISEGLWNQGVAQAGGARAYGGDVLAGMKYTVGERGAETFTPATNGTITPTGEGSGGLVVNIGSINANSEAGGRAAARGFKEELEMLWAGRGNG